MQNNTEKNENEGKEVFLFDIDGTISEDIPNEEEDRMPDAYVIPGAVEYCNSFYDQGHLIVFFTARLEKHRKVTEEWLNKFGFKYHAIVFGKPRIYGFKQYHWVDNAPIHATRFLGSYQDAFTPEGIALKPKEAFVEKVLELLD